MEVLNYVNNSSSKSGYKCLIFLALLFLTADLSSLVLTYKYIQFGPIYFSAEALIFPLTYTITDIIAEVYGYNKAREIIWLVFLFDFIFALFTFILIKTPSPTTELQTTYNYVFHDLLRGTLAEVVGVLSGIFINIYAISRLKILTKGRYFWLRSIGSSLVGEAILVLVSMPILFIGKSDTGSLGTLIIFAVAIVYPATIAVRIVKHIEQLDVYDYNVSFNPFAVFMKKEHSYG